MEEISENTILQPLILHQAASTVAREDTLNNCVCIFCSHQEKNENDNKKILQHLYFSHRLVISDVHEVADLKAYLNFWKDQFKGRTNNRQSSKSILTV